MEMSYRPCVEHRLGQLALLVATGLLVACGHEWDSLDPRLGTGSGGASATVGANAGGASAGAGGVGLGGMAATSSASSSSAGASAGSGGSGTGGAASTVFLDDFERPDSDNLGNGWIEKLPTVYSIAGGEVVRIATDTSYRDNLCHRPASEDALDAEAAIEVRFTEVPLGYAQIFVRAQSATLAAPGSYDG
jgi:hypothetical protein